ncbi:MAG TPA: LysR family transcriptional regulator [Isosphaeraceae bacterium]|nr:LysR family transcriptional regulator [Isosphaeraceae bacterium]
MASALDLKVLRMLVAIDRHGSVTRAAEALGITQSALSHHIKETERRAAVSLFHRVNRRLHFTAMGEEILGAAKAIMGEVDRVEADLELFRKGYGPVVRIGSGAYGCEGWLPRFIAELAGDRGQFDIEVLGGLTFPLVNAVIDGALDLAICGGEVADRRVRVFPLFKDELVGVLPSGHPLARRAHLEPGDFRDEIYLTYSTVPEKGFEDDRFFRPAKTLPRRWVKAGDVAMIVEMVRAGLGVSILSHWAIAERASRAGIQTKRLTRTGLPTRWQAVIRANELKDSASAKLGQRLSDWWARYPRLAAG